MSFALDAVVAQATYALPIYDRYKLKKENEHLEIRNDQLQKQRYK